MEILLKVVGYISILALIISFAFMIKTLGRARRLNVRSLIVPILISIAFLVLYRALLDLNKLTGVSIGLVIFGMAIGIIWSRTTRLTIKGRTVFAQKSVWYVIIWGLSIIITQFLAMTATQELVTYGLSTVYFSTGLVVSTNTGLFARYIKNLRTVPADTWCSSCGKVNSQGTNFCTQCGQPAGRNFA